MVKRILMTAVLGVAGTMVAADRSDAGIYFRPVRPVRRVAARAVLPPYPVARRAVVGPVYRPVVAPVYAPAVYGSPYLYGGPGVYGSGVSVSVGF